ncbi:MAG: tetratricopeptide repeat protein, partial [Candidatus Neomarinimicrobiota bacterium]
AKTSAPRPLIGNTALGIVAALAILVAAWSWFEAGDKAPEIRSIAVLPLVNLMNDTDQDYFVDGMHEALTAELSKISALRVIGRTSTMSYKANPKPIPEIAAELDVDAVIEGSVLLAGDVVRITAQLVATRPERHIWANDYERSMDKVLALHKDVAQAIAREIRVTLTPKEKTHLTDDRPVDPEAYKAYLKGRYFFHRFTKEDLDQALDHFRQALDIDPDFASAYAGLATTYLALADMYLPPSKCFPKAGKFAEMAIQLDERLAEPHTTLAAARAWWEWKWDDSRRELDRALELDPNHAEAYWTLISYWWAMNDPAEALRSARKACELDPLSATYSLFLEWSLITIGQYDDAIAQHDITQKLSPGLVYGESTLGVALGGKGLYDEAMRAFEEAERTIGHSSPNKGVMLAEMGRKEEALEIAQELEGIFGETYIIPEYIASVYAAVGDKERAYFWLERGLEERSSGVISIQTLPALRTLHGEQRFKDILKRVGLE